MTLFSLLPPEINTQLLLNVPASQAFELCRQPEFEDLCDWSYWRNKALFDFQVPRSYFDLALNRGISGDYRYLEISTRFIPSLDSLASINNGIVSGIYEPATLLSLAFDRNQPDLVRALIPMVNQDFLEYLYKEKITAGFIPNNFTIYGPYLPPPVGALIGHLTIYNLLASAVEGKVFDNLPQFYYDLEDKNWIALDQEFFNIEGFFRVQVILAMIYSQDDQAWSVAQKYISLYEENIKVFFLRAALECGNKSQVDWILQYLPEVKTNPRKFSSIIYNVPQYFGAYDRFSNFQSEFENIKYNFILDAYCGANLELIQQFDSYGYNLDIIYNVGYYINRVVAIGYGYGLSNPVAVYDLARQLIEKGIFLRFIPGDIDINALVIQPPKTLDQFKQVLENLLPGNMTKHVSWDYFKVNIKKRGDDGNVDALNWVLGQYYNIPGASGVIQDHLGNVSSSYPLTRKILEAYLKIAS